ncbi:unnamed protein product [Arctia plantaginis]|uniref:Uncharacterized protein n=1 Tax=Arctia plantaginis TaxID=874455 RepID=A0A8S0Z7R0_ARCPL|nr:unnamed protein product [Arctia plantaginis]
MSLMRSPGSGSNIGRSGSQPNLAVAGTSAQRLSEASSIAFRNKRKHGNESEVQTQLDSIQKQITDIMALLTSSVNSQNENYAKLSKDVVSIRDQMQDIKIIMNVNELKVENISSEQKEIKSNIKNLSNSMQMADGKIASLESNMNEIGKSAIQSTSNDKFRSQVE